MPQIPKHHKLKRATVLIKRGQCLRNYPKFKSYKPLCEKLKNNNNNLAKALSKEKQASRLLFSQNVALVAEVQDLGVACSKRDVVISNFLKNAKELLGMLVTMSGCVTNTISSCQEFAATSGLNLQMNCNSAGKRDSIRRFSTKSPAKGVVKPMVSGHTITKPTINLSRVNIQRINNPSNLSIIEEVSPVAIREQEIPSPRSPVAVTLRQKRCETARVCRMPERLTVASPRISEENERRLSKRSSRHSARMSGRHSRPKSSRLSGNHRTTRSTEHVEHIGSPRVKLNDVSKLLRNSQSINIRMLSESRNEILSDSPESNEETAQKTANTCVTIPESPATDSPKRNGDRTGEESVNETPNISNKPVGNRSKVKNRTSNWDDPLEGPSWLFNDSQSAPCSSDRSTETDHENTYDDNDEHTTSLNMTSLNNTMDCTENAQNDSPLPALSKQSNHVQTSKREKLSRHEKSYGATPPKKTCDDNFSNVTASPAAVEANENVCKDRNEATTNFLNFVTQRRNYFEQSDDDMDEFTLMYTRQPRNMHFDINDLRLPVLETSVINPRVVNEPEPEITATIQKITCPIPSASNNTLNESAFNQSTVKLPVLLNNDYENDATPVKDKPSETSKQKKKTKKATVTETDDYINNSAMYNNSNGKQKKKTTSTKDPSSAKVVLQKLNESEVKQRTPSPDELYTQDSTYSVRSPASPRTDNSSDSESSNTSTSSMYTLNRPRRKRAPTTLQEPSLKRKLRRYH